MDEPNDNEISWHEVEATTVHLVGGWLGAVMLAGCFSAGSLWWFVALSAIVVYFWSDLRHIRPRDAVALLVPFVAWTGLQIVDGGMLAPGGEVQATVVRDYGPEFREVQDCENEGMSVVCTDDIAARWLVEARVDWASEPREFANEVRGQVVVFDNKYCEHEAVWGRPERAYISPGTVVSLHCTRILAKPLWKLSWDWSCGRRCPLR